MVEMLRISFIRFSPHYFFTANNIFPVEQPGVHNLAGIIYYTFLTGDFNLCNSRLCGKRHFICNLQPKGFKSHVVSEIPLLAWPWLSLTKKTMHSLSTIQSE